MIAGCSSGPHSTKEMTRGEKLFRGNCRACHHLPNPKKHTDEDWPTYVNRYGSYIKLNEADRQEITAFLQQAND